MANAKEPKKTMNVKCIGTLKGIQRKVPPAVVRSLVAEYIIDDMLPLSMVESPAFRKSWYVGSSQVLLSLWSYLTESQYLCIYRMLMN